MDKGKVIGGVIFGLVALTVATVGTFYLAGVVYTLLSKQPADVGLTTWYAYWHHYGAYPSVAKKLKTAMVVAGGICYGVPLFMVLMNLKKRRELHGSARFASPAEVAKSSLNDANGIVVGKFQGKYLIFGGQQFAIVAAPTRSGKGVGFVIPNLLQFADSIVVLDIKQENFEITAGFRKKHGHEVYLFNPFAEDFRTHRYNMLEYISDDPKYRVSDVQSIGMALYPDPANGKDPFFDQAARNLFMGLVLYLCETPSLPRTIGEILRQSSGKGKPVKEYLQGIINSRNFTEVEEWQDVLDADGVVKVDKTTGEIKQKKVIVLKPREYNPDDDGDPPLSNHCVDALNRFLNTSENTLTSILASLNAPLTIWANPIVDAATSCNDFDLRDVRKRRMTIYIGVTPDHLSEARLLVNVLFSQLVNLNTKELPKQNKALKHQCLLLMDEFTAIGKVDIIAKAVSYMAGYNLRLAPIIQSVSQLTSVYGQEDARTFITNHALQIMYAPREQKDANEYSEMLGYQTEKAKSRTRQFGKGSGSESTSDQRRALMLPQELKELGQWKEIVMLENMKPILCDKIKYFEDPVFTERLLPPPAVPLIDVDLYQAIVEARMREATAEDLGDSVDLSRLVLDLDVIPDLDEDRPLSGDEVSAMVDSIFAGMGFGEDVIEASREADEATPGREAEAEGVPTLPADDSTLNVLELSEAEPAGTLDLAVAAMEAVDGGGGDGHAVTPSLQTMAADDVDLSVLEGDALVDEASDDSPPAEEWEGGDLIDMDALDDVRFAGSAQ